MDGWMNWLIDWLIDWFLHTTPKPYPAAINELSMAIFFCFCCVEFYLTELQLHQTWNKRSWVTRRPWGSGRARSTRTTLVSIVGISRFTLLSFGSWVTFRSWVAFVSWKSWIARDKRCPRLQIHCRGQCVYLSVCLWESEREYAKSILKNASGQKDKIYNLSLFHF